MSALTKATKTRLTASSELWGGRVYKAAPLVSEDKPATYPYVVCTLAGGGIKPITKFKWVEVLWQLRAVAKNQDVAYQCQARLSELFRDADISSAIPLDGGANWEISTVSELGMFDLIETIDSDRLFHAGSVFRITMQEK